MKTVFVALHYQNEVLHAGGRIKVGMAEDAQNRDAVKARAGRLLAFARASGIPVVSVRIAFRPDHADVIQNCTIFRNVVAGKAMVDGSWGAEFHEGLGPIEGEHVVKHTRVNAFYGSELEDVLRVLKAERLIIAGIATNSVVITTVACAADVGYEVIVAADACSSANSELHQASLEIMRLVADVADVESIVAQLSRPAS
ncbi:cysteine hydrolase [Rhizobium sp. KVB221]|uniref:Cysteine hydrolase n=1 Tax=Rhizobium setariae TaxID=2801340 RepID=A0A937CQC0_9HYPH|nr:isochorismatase family cysteine hydrolase [Rhizobium setariae]MBL0374259.1 cysteine hydrolase [Rhizobium setariae]